MGILRRQALEVAALLPEDTEDALIVLALARSAIKHVDSLGAANDEVADGRKVRLTV